MCTYVCGGGGALSEIYFYNSTNLIFLIKILLQVVHIDKITSIYTKNPHINSYIFFAVEGIQKIQLKLYINLAMDQF